MVIFQSKFQGQSRLMRRENKFHFSLGGKVEYLHREGSKLWQPSLEVIYQKDLPGFLISYHGMAAHQNG